MVAAARQRRPDAAVLARAKDALHARSLLQMGAAVVVLESVEASLQLGGRLLEQLGLPDEAVLHRLAQMREQEFGRVAAASDQGALRRNT
jgi:CPA2 family monovalent cation:H+ antiporter-2